MFEESEFAMVGGPTFRTLRKLGTKPDAEGKFETEQVFFEEVSFYDRMKLLQDFWLEKRQKLEQLYKDTQLSNDQVALELREFDGILPNDTMWSKFFNTDTGKIAILRRSLEKTGDPNFEARAQNLGMSAKDIAKLAGYVSWTPVFTFDADGNAINPDGTPVKKVSSDPKTTTDPGTPSKMEETSKTSTPSSSPSPMFVKGFGKA